MNIKNKDSIVIKGDSGGIVISGNVNGSNIVTGNNNQISLDSNKQDYILRKVADELLYEGEDVGSIYSKTEVALYDLTSRLARRLRTTHEVIVNALRELGARI